MNRKPFLTTSTVLILALLLLSLALPATPALAAPFAAPAVDGDGAMTVSPDTAAYGSTGNTFTFTFTPTGGRDFVDGSSVMLTIPAGWPAPVKLGNVSVATGTCAINPSWSVAASIITVDVVSCLSGQSFTITYSGVTVPGAVGSSAMFLTQTDIPGGDGTFPIAVSPTVTIAPKPITVTADAKSKAVDAADPAFTYTFTPALGAGDTFSGALTRDPGETPGQYAITQGTLSAGSNYAITYVGANLTINPSISGSVAVSGVTLTYTDNGLKTALSGAGGAYSLIVSYGWSGSVTPSKSGYVFNPTKLSYTNVSANQTDRNYLAKAERVKNGGFNTYVGASKIPQYWTAAKFTAADGKDSLIKKEGAASLKMTGAAGVTKTLTQTVKLSGASGSAFTFSLWIKGTSIPAAGTCLAQVSLYNGAALQMTKIIRCANSTYGFKSQTLSFTTTSAYTKVVIQLIYAKSKGTVWFDGVSLTK